LTIKIALVLALPKFSASERKRLLPGDQPALTFPPTIEAHGMGLELLSMTVFWTWHAFQPAPLPLPEVRVMPTKVILQATWIEPVALRDETSPPIVREPAAKKTIRTSKPRVAPPTQKLQEPLWKSAKSWELPPILWASFEAFLAAGLGIVSLVKS
jgi:hypothetical protein